jgi:L-alanine-DL-glutamate epimerase-like enolase superfamily enzyme
MISRPAILRPKVILTDPIHPDAYSRLCGHADVVVLPEHLSGENSHAALRALMPDEARYYQSINMAAYKIHPPQSWREDIKVCEAVRKAVGDDYLLMLDSVWSYDYPAALRVGQAIEAMNFYWYEDPLADADIYNYVELKKQLSIPIMATEYPAAGLDSYAPWIKERATDFLRGDVAVKGGITTLMKTAHLVEAFHLMNCTTAAIRSTMSRTCM